jgi:hypothetical protein
MSFLLGRTVPHECLLRLFCTTATIDGVTLSLVDGDKLIG